MSRRRLLLTAAGVAVVVATFVFVLPRIANYGDVWEVIRDLNWKQIGILVLVTVLNIATFAPPYMTALPGLGFTRALILTQASTAATYVAPGGAAVGIALAFAMLRGWGFSPAAVALAVALTGAWNQLFMLFAPAVALALLTLAGESNPLLETVAFIGLTVFVAVIALLAAAFSGENVARWVGNSAARAATSVLRLVRRSPVAWTGDALADFRVRAVGLLRRRWWLLTIATAVGHLSVFVVLITCLRTLGVSGAQVTLVEAFAAWTLIRLLGSIPVTPGGLGIVELGLTSALVGFGGNNAGVVAAVLLYRFLTMVPTLVLGLLAVAASRRFRTGPAPAL